MADDKNAVKNCEDRQKIVPVFVSSFDVGVWDIYLLCAFLNFLLIFMMNAFFLIRGKKKTHRRVFESEKHEAQFKILYKPPFYAIEEHSSVL